MAGSGYVLQVDHSVSPLVEYETYKFFVERGLEIGTYAGMKKSNDEVYGDFLVARILLTEGLGYAKILPHNCKR